MAQDEFEYRIGRLAIAEGDVLVLKVAGHMSKDMAKSIRSICADRLPKGVNCLVIDSQIDLFVLQRADVERLGLKAA